MKNIHVSNTRSNTEIAAMIQAKAMNEGDILLALCLAIYMEDPSIDTEKIGFDEWLTEDKFEDITAFLLNKLMEDRDLFSNEGWWESAEEYGLTSDIQDWNLENKDVCKFILEEAEKAGTLELCPRCGGSRSQMDQSRYARIKICRSCQKDEAQLEARNKMLTFTGWHFIEFLKEQQNKAA